jgi:autotransporter-associated beta strand protein
VSYQPGAGGKWDLPSEFAAAVTMSGSTGYTAHTTQVNGGGGQFNLNSGTVTARSIDLASHATTPGKILMNGGTVTFNPYGGVGTTVIRSTGSLAQPGVVELGTPVTAGPTFSVGNGTASVDLDVRAAVTGAGRLSKNGAGTMQLSAANSHTGGTNVGGGTLQITADNRLGAVPGSAQANNITLSGGTLRTGTQVNSVSLTNAGSGYTSFPTLTIGGAGADAHPASANVLAGINSIAVTNGGSGYVNQASAPTPNGPGTFVDIVGGGGTGATARAVVSGGVVTGIVITNPGTGYTSMPTVYISSTATAGIAGDGATANVSGIALQGIALNDGGFDYANPTISLTGGGGTGAAASATSTANWAINANRGIQIGPNGGTLHQTAGSTLTYGGVIAPAFGAPPGSFTKAGPGTLVLNGANTYTGTTNVNAGLLVAGHADAIGSASLAIASGANVRVQQGIAGVPSVAGVAVNGTGRLDLNDTGLVDRNNGSGFTGQSVTRQATALLKSGLENGGAFDWHGPGISSTEAFNDNAAVGSVLYGLGVIQNNLAAAGTADGTTVDQTAGNEIYTSFKGRTVGLNDTLVKFTYMGDADLSGVVDGTDYSLIDGGLASALSGWLNGDFDYSGAIDSTDYALIDNAFASQVGALNEQFLARYEQSLATFGQSYVEALALVQAGVAPEPGALGVLALAGVGAVARRRRRRP